MIGRRRLPIDDEATMGTRGRDGGDNVYADNDGPLDARDAGVGRLLVAPSDQEIRTALADKLDQPSCVTDVDYAAFSVMPAQSLPGEGHPSLDAMVNVGLLAKDGETYVLTTAGRGAYRSERQGFCYSAGYEVRKVLDVATVPGDQAGTPVDKAWVVTLSIAQKPIADWARMPAIAARALDKNALSTEPRTYHVTLARFRGAEGLKRDDPMFMLPAGFSY